MSLLFSCADQLWWICSIKGSWTGDFGREHTLKSLTVEWEACQCAKADSVLVDVSTDGKSWKRFATFGGWHQWGGRKKRSVSGSGQARYVRLTGTMNTYMHMRV